MRWALSFASYTEVARQTAEQFLDQLSEIMRALRLLAAQSYASFDVGSTQAKFLRHLGQQQPLSQAELARATATDPTLAGRVVQSLIARGWVHRSTRRDDRRQYLLSLTASGQRMRKRVLSARRRVAERLVRGLDKKDLIDCERIEHKLKAALANEAE